MTSVFAKYQSASFREIPFLMEKEAKTGGPRVVIHEYPNSKKRFIESIGEIPASFNMDCIVHGNDAINDRLTFENALNDQSMGILVHPIYGNLEVKVVAPYSVKSSQKTIGEFRFNVNFAVTEKKITPATSAIDAGQVAVNADTTCEAVNNALDKSYKNPGFVDSLTAASDKITDMTEATNKQILKVAGPIQDNVAAFNRVVASIKAGSLTIVSDASTVKQALVDLFDGFQDIAETPADLTDAWTSLTDFNLFRDAPSTSTVKQAEIANNESNLDTHMRLTALARTFESQAFTDFQTDVEIDNARQTLNSKFDELVSLTGAGVSAGSIIDPVTDETISGTIPVPEIETTSSTDYVGLTNIAIDPDVRSAFAELRANTFSVLDDKEQNVFKIKTNKLYQSSIPLATYEFYGSLDNLSVVENLNPLKNRSLIRGNTKMVTL